MKFLDSLLNSDSDDQDAVDEDSADSDSNQTPTVDMTLEGALTLLSNERRRVTIRVLSRADRPLTKRDLVNHVAAYEYRNHPKRLDSDQIKRVYVALYQTHLPMLDDAGVLDNASMGIEAEPAADALAEIVDDVDTYLTGGEP